MLLDFMAQNKDVMRWVKAAKYVCENGTAIECGYFFDNVYAFEGRPGSEDMIKSFTNVGYHMKNSDQGEQVKTSFLISLNTLFQVIDQRAKIWITGEQV